MSTTLKKRDPRLIGAGAAAPLVILLAGNAAADDSVSWSLAYTGDVIAGWNDEIDASGAYLDNLDLVMDADLGAIGGWRGATLHAHVLNNAGAAPNDRLGTLQGVDNIEVSRERLRLFEFWVEQAWDGGSIRAGLYDLNSEFYANDAAGLLIAPAFGIGSELAATGANGPSIFPSTALAARGRFETSEHGSLMVAVLNANAGVIGDPGSVDTDFDEGALVIGEYAWTGSGKIAFGAWGYTDDQDDIRELDLGGDPVQRDARGAYVAFEHPIRAGVDGFARIGVSDGDTTPYAGGWQAGLLVDRPLASRPDSQISVGAYQGVLSDKHRANEADVGIRAARAETGIELTYSDRITPWLRVQPDLQIVLDPGGDRDRDHVWVVGLRFEITPFQSPWEG
ncbi:carbohydrate-selective porin [alpha proteobacterium U9-1i]|nr:carbohydrate-selective porin [alpha proteobacterium U9-1i]